MTHIKQYIIKLTTTLVLVLMFAGCNLNDNRLRGHVIGGNGSNPSLSPLVFDESNINVSQLSSKIIMTPTNLPNGQVQLLFEMYEGIQKNKVSFTNLPSGAVLSCNNLTGNLAIQRSDISTEKFFQIQPTYWVATENDWIAQEGQEFSCHYELSGQSSNEIVFMFHLKESYINIVSRPQYTGTEVRSLDVYESSISGDGRYVAFSARRDVTGDDENTIQDIFVYDRETGRTTRVSKSSSGLEANGESHRPRMSEDGRYIAFASDATNLVSGDTNGVRDIFLHDRQTAETTRVSVSSSGVQANSGSWSPSVSADGRYVAFACDANNLVAGDANGSFDVFVHDRQTSVTTRVSVDSGGLEGNANSYESHIGGSGRYVTFVSIATNLVASDTNGFQDVFVHDRQTSTTSRISLESSGLQGNQDSWSPNISTDGRYVSFESRATNLVLGDSNLRNDIFVHDRQTGFTTRVSVGNGGIEGDDFSSYPVMSSNGRYIAFESPATNLVSSDTNGSSDIFVHDRQTSVTTRVSVNSSGVEANDGSYEFPSLSADGRFISYYSYATNLVSSDTNGNSDIFVHDRQTSVTTRVSVDVFGVNGANSHSYITSISTDGRYISFDSIATNLISGDTNFVRDIFVNDRQTGIISRVSVSSGGIEADGASYYHKISGDGRYVTFASSATNLVPADSNASLDIFVHDRQTGVTTRVSVDSTGIEANGFSTNPSISESGRYVTFTSSASNLVPADSNAVNDIFVHDRQTGVTIRVSVDSVGIEANGASEFADISEDGRYIAFASSATNLVSGDTNGSSDIFVHDRQTGSTTRVSLDSIGGETNGISGYASINQDGRYITFISSATNLVAGDTNGVQDIFVHDRQTGATTRVSVSSIGAQANGAAGPAGSISADGRFISFYSSATNLVSGDTNGVDDIFVHDLQNNSTLRINLDSNGAQANGNSTNPSISRDGRYVSFTSGATNLVLGDVNGSEDIFVVKIP